MPKSQISVQKLMDAETIAKAATSYSSVTKFSGCTGSAVLEIISTAGSITVSQQCSINYDPGNPTAATWYDPIDTADSALGVIQSAQGVTTGLYVAFTPVLTPWIRFKVVEGNSAATVVTLRLLYRLEV